jgi:hypothetical protein
VGKSNPTSDSKTGVLGSALEAVRSSQAPVPALHHPRTRSAHRPQGRGSGPRTNARLSPRLAILEQVPVERVREAEPFWTERLIAAEHHLTNGEQPVPRCPSARRAGDTRGASHKP